MACIFTVLDYRSIYQDDAAAHLLVLQRVVRQHDAHRVLALLACGIVIQIINTNMKTIFKCLKTLLLTNLNLLTLDEDVVAAVHGELDRAAADYDGSLLWGGLRER